MPAKKTETSPPRGRLESGFGVGEEASLEVPDERAVGVIV